MEDLSLEALFGIEGKNVVVSGGSKGIGSMLAAGFVQQGCNVFIFSRKPEFGAAKTLNELGKGKCWAFACDVSKQEAIESVVSEVSNVLKKEGLPQKIDVLVNNSGAVWADPFLKTSRQSFDKLVNVNLTGLFFVCQAFGKMLMAAGTKTQPSRIINIASIDGISTPSFEEYAYAATKSAVIHLTNVMAGNLAKRNITVNAISPGLFPSKMGDQVLTAGGPEVTKSIPLGRAGMAQDIFSACLFLAGPGGAYTTGANIVVDGGMNSKPRL